MSILIQFIIAEFLLYTARKQLCKKLPRGDFEQGNEYLQILNRPGSSVVARWRAPNDPGSNRDPETFHSVGFTTYIVKI